MKKILIISSIFLSFSSYAAFVFHGSDSLPININQEQNKNNFIGSYTLSNVPSIFSKLIINKNNTFDWYMNYKNVNLQTKGKWEKTEKDILSLTTDPYPENIPFVYEGTPNMNNPSLPKFFSDGTVQMNVSDNVNGNKNGIKGLKVFCQGSIKSTTVFTDNNGWAVCYGVGLPLSDLRISAESINMPNKTDFVKPNFNNGSLQFNFDYINASTDYAFVQERMKINNDNTIEWNPISLKGNSIWKYVKEKIN